MTSSWNWLRARDHLFQTDDEEAVAFRGLSRDRLRLGGVFHDGGDIERLGVRLFFSLGRGLDLLGDVFDGLGALLGIFFLGGGGGLAGLLVGFELA